MKKIFAGFIGLPLILLTLSGCSGIGAKNASLSVIYGITAVLSLLLLVGYCCVARKKSNRKDKWFFMLFPSVLVVNIGYFLLSVSGSLEQALMANRLAYLGSVLLPLSMFLIILDATNTGYRKWLPGILLAISALVLFVAASPGYLDIYYKEVSFAVVNGVATLVKVYGPWHILYLFFLLGYFIAIVTVIIRAAVKKTIDSTAHGVILAIAVLVNIGVWLIEQLTNIPFEMLSVSYIISELFLLGLHLVIGENRRLQALIRESQTAQSFPSSAEITKAAKDERTKAFLSGISDLTQTERKIFDAYVARLTTKEVLVLLNITQNTLKYHNKNIYSKLGVSSRNELLELYKQLHT